MGRHPRVIACRLGLAAGSVLMTTPRLLAAEKPSAPAEKRTTGLSIDAGWAGAFDPTSPIPVRVTISADRLVKGDLLITGDGPPVRVPIEVAGGSRKLVVAAVPSSESSSRTTVEAKIDGLAPASVELEERTDNELVGLTEGVRRGQSLPSPAPLAIEAGQARFAAVGDNEFALGPTALAGLSAIAATPRELAALRPSLRATIVTWVSRGGQLLVGADPGVKLAGWPSGLQPAQPGGRVRYGDGVVVAAGSRLGLGSWDGLIAPTLAGQRKIASAGFGRRAIPLAVGDELLADTGLRVPRVGWMMPTIVLYGLAMGALLLWRRRFARFFVAPLLAVLVGTGVAAAGRGARAQVLPAHATILDVTPAGTTATTFVGLARTNPGRARVRFDRGWASQSVSNALNSGSVSASGTAVADITGGRLREEVDLGPAGFGVVAASGPVAARGELEVIARAEADDRLAGTVHNTTPWVLHDVAVFSGTASTLVGDLTPDETREWSAFVADVATRADAASGTEVWPAGSRFGLAEGPVAVNFAAWWEWASTRVPKLFTPGRVVAVGWTRDRDVRVDLGGTHAVVAKGRTGIVGRGEVTGDAKKPPRIAIIRTIVRGGKFDGRDGIARFDIPPKTGPLQVRAPNGARIEVWQNGGWKPLQAGPPPPGSAAADSTSSATADTTSSTVTTTPPLALSWNGLPLPPVAISHGSVYIRASGVAINSTSFAPIELVTVSGLTQTPGATDEIGRAHV